MRPHPAWMPVLALLFVALFATVMLATRGGESDRGAPLGPTRDGDGDPAQGVDARRAGNVCQGTVARPGEGEPRRFAEVYSKRRTVRGVVIVGIEEVDDRAFDVAEDTIREILDSDELSEPLVSEGAYVIITAPDQRVLDLPEFACLASTAGAAAYDHVCGVADRADYPVVTVNALDLLGDRAGPCRGLNILFHEIGHLVHGWALGPADYVDVRLLYQDALDAGKYQGAYASRNTHEYFAEATQAYFLALMPSGGKDRGWLAEYDPGIYELLSRVYGD